MRRRWRMRRGEFSSDPPASFRARRPPRRWPAVHGGTNPRPDSVAPDTWSEASRRHSDLSPGRGAMQRRSSSPPTSNPGPGPGGGAPPATAPLPPGQRDCGRGTGRGPAPHGLWLSRDPRAEGRSRGRRLKDCRGRVRPTARNPRTTPVDPRGTERLIVSACAEPRHPQLDPGPPSAPTRRSPSLPSW